MTILNALAHAYSKDTTDFYLILFVTFVLVLFAAGGASLRWACDKVCDYLSPEQPCQPDPAE